MRPQKNAITLGLVTALVTITLACRHGGIPLINLFGINKPVVIALVTDNALATLNPFLPYEPLRKAMSADFKRDVALDLCFLQQVAFGLDNGFYHFAMLTPLQYAQLARKTAYPVVAIPRDTHGRAVRPALLVVRANGDIEEIEQLRGKVIAFGPASDARTTYAGLELLARHGVEKTDLALEALPLPGSLKNVLTMRAVAQSVINNSSAAGFIDQAAWEALPERDNRRNEPARDKLRVIGQTRPVPDLLLVASPKTDEKTTHNVREFLLRIEQEHPDAARAMQIDGYVVPESDVLESCRRILIGDAKQDAEPR